MGLGKGAALAAAPPFAGELSRDSVTEGGTGQGLRPWGSARFRLAATYFLCAQKVGKDALRGENPVRLRPPKGGATLTGFSP